MFVLITWLPWARLYWSTAGPHLVLLWRTCCWLSLALLSMELSAAADGNEPPVCMPGLPKAPGDLKLAGYGEHPGWRPLVRRGDWQCLWHTGESPEGFWTIGKNKIKKTIIITLSREQFWCAAACLLHWMHGRRTRKVCVGEVMWKFEQVAGGWVCSLTFPPLEKQLDDGKTS